MNMKKKNEKTEENEYQNTKFHCPSCLKLLNNVTGVYLIKVCGHVICLKCMENFVLPSESCIVCEHKFDKQDIIPLQSEGSSFSSRSGESLVPTVITPYARV